MIDVAAFTGPWPWRPVGMSAACLATHLSRHGIASALVTPLEGMFWDDPQQANERLAEELPGLPLTLVPALDPTFPSWRRDLESCLNRYGARSVRILPGYRGFGMEDPACEELLHLAGREGIAVFVQLRMLDSRGHSMLAQYPDVSASSVLAAASRAPSTRIVLGGARLGEIRAICGELRRLGSVWVETSAVEHLDGIRTLIGLVGRERILFGSHTPLFITGAATLKIEEARLEVEEKRAIGEANARELLSM